ncbi:hypothetical protein BURMUCGD2M_3314 [Burkholderia multivorans CGD2M]|uniref:Uncharacterized protein n=1 Tax=Burkholderia multivorans CGD2 TaxID=513052 RepID=B9BXS4_9BURK|nr:hypothetical protein BURMUCGD2_3227 [Burkholderia multivorans CGD2]EEE10031.1 hypothetical protein BURMUCGD2M_3314 [Burkholderia multivorans CGD2M]
MVPEQFLSAARLGKPSVRRTESKFALVPAAGARQGVARSPAE